MISDACGVSVATVFFYFENKEGYYCSVFNHASQLIKDRSLNYNKKVFDYIKSNRWDEETTWDMIDLFFETLLNLLRHPEDSILQVLLLREEADPPKGLFPIMDVVHEQIEKTLIDLIQTFDKAPSYEDVALCFRLILGSVISQTEHPGFLQRSLGLEPNSPLPEDSILKIKQFCINNVRSLLIT